MSTLLLGIQNHLQEVFPIEYFNVRRVGISDFKAHQGEFNEAEVWKRAQNGA